MEERERGREGLRDWLWECWGYGREREGLRDWLWEC